MRDREVGIRLLRCLADMVKCGESPTPGEVLAAARERYGESFKKWSAKGVASHLRRYSLTTNKSHGRKVYGRVSLDDLRAIQLTYRVDLGLDSDNETRSLNLNEDGDEIDVAMINQLQREVELLGLLMQALAENFTKYRSLLERIRKPTEEPKDGS